MTYIHDQIKFLAKILPKPIKTVVKTIYTQLLYKINRNTHTKYKMTSLI